MRVLDNVIYGLKFAGIKRRDAEKIGLEMLEKVHLKGEEKKLPSQLSGGQQQRVALARGLVTHPKLLLLDEPLSNLDAKLRLELRSEIKAIQREFNITTIFVTHDQEEAFSVADKIMLMNEGELVQFDMPRNLYEKPATKFSLDFIGSVNYDEKNNRFCRLEDVYFCKEGEEMEVLGSSFKGQLMEYVLLTSDGTIIRTVSLDKSHEYGTGEKVRAVVKWSALDDVRRAVSKRVDMQTKKTSCEVFLVCNIILYLYVLHILLF